MARTDLLRFILFSATVSFALSIGEPAQARDSRCPPGTHSPDGNVCVPGGSMYDEVQLMKRGRPSNLPPRDREGEKLEAEVRLLGVAAINQARLLMDPDYIRYLTGKWMLFPSPEDKPKGEFCSVLFSREGVILNFMGPGGDSKGSLLTFMSADIPRPKTPEVVKITLKQNDEPPETFYAVNSSNRNDSFGSIYFPIQLDATLANMKNVTNFDLQMDGKPIAKIMLHSGLAMRDEFRKCLSGKPYGVTQIDLMGK